MKWVSLMALAVLAACSDPALSAGLRLTEEGLVVRPAASAGLGGFRVAVTP